MEEWLRDALAEEQGYTICPLSFGTYIHCNNNCDLCEDYIDLKKSIIESGDFNG